MNTDPTTQVDPPFLALVLDDDLIAAEFEAIIAAEWPELVRQPRKPAARWGQLSSRDEARDTRETASVRLTGQRRGAALPGRQRSPPLPADT